MALNLYLYNIFAHQKIPLLKISDDLIACDSWFAPLPPIKNSANVYCFLTTGYSHISRHRPILC